MLRKGPRMTRTLFAVATGSILTLLLVIGGVAAYNLVAGSSDAPPSATVLLNAVNDLARFDAVQGTFQESIDVQTEPSRWPDWIVGHRVQFIAVGTVDAYVDFSGVNSGQIVVNGRSVELQLPHAQLDKPNLDQKLSHVVAEQPGLADRVRTLFTNEPDGAVAKVYQDAVDAMAMEAAHTDLKARAEANTRTMLVGMMRNLHFQQVTVTYH
jgi:hypothetical protein